jgi:hypothetical protein
MKERKKEIGTFLAKKKMYNQIKKMINKYLDKEKSWF